MSHGVDNIENSLDASKDNEAVFILAVQFVIVFNPLLIGKYLGSSLKADSMLLDVDPVLVVIPLDERFSNSGFHSLSITQR